MDNHATQMYAAHQHPGESQLRFQQLGSKVDVSEMQVLVKSSMASGRSRSVLPA